MSGLEALSLAANIIEIISFAGEATRLCKHVYNNGRIEPQLESLAVSLEAVAKETQAHQANLVTKTDIDLRLEEMASKCQVAARELSEEVQYLHKGSKQGDLTAAVRVAVKVNWRKRRLDRLEATLAKFQAAMQTQLLYRVCKEQDAAIREQRLATNDTNATVRQLVAAYSSGQTNISLHIEKESTTIRDHVSSQNKSLEESLAAHVTQSSRTLERSIGNINEQSSSAVVDKLSRHLDNLTMERAALEKRQRLLQSLKFAEMNGRINAVEDAHSGTFEWIFDEGFSEQLEEPDYMFDSSNDLDLTSSNGVADAPADSGLLAHGGEDDHSYWETDSNSEAEGYGVEDGCYHSAPIEVQGWDDFAEWLKSESQFYWISGHPGSGKSTLVKFLALHSKTQNALHTWRPQVTVLHHFFWKPGTSMQNSIRGLLCTLAYQVLSSRTDALEFCVQQPSLLTKATCSDWSLKELKVLTFSLLRKFTPVCIFVDGLDEAPELDYCRSLLDLLHSMASLSNVKLCAASRPEPVVKRRLELHPHLRLQDLTADDMWAFVKAAFENERRHLDRKQRAELRSLAKLLVRRAEGVFLWLRLAVADTLRDLASGYNFQDLHERVERLPHMLTALYHDMWSRLNSDRSEDHRAGAAILNLVLIAKQFGAEELITFDGSEIGAGARDLTLADMLAMQHPETPRSRPSAINFDDRAMTQQLQRTARDIRDRSAGLLDIFPLSHKTDRSRIDLMNAKVDFIHRSAYDFLVDTSEGQNIRSKDTSSIQSRWIRYFSVLMSPMRTNESPLPYYHVEFLDALIRFWPPQIRQDWSEDKAATELLDELAASFLSDGFAENRYNGPTELINREAALCISMAAYPLYGWIRAFISRLPTNLRAQIATEVLRHIRYWWGKKGPLCESDLVEFQLRLLGDLLDLGASPYEYGPIFFELVVHKGSIRSYYSRRNAITEICIDTCEVRPSSQSPRMWTTQPDWLAPAILKKIFGQIAKHGIVPEGHVILEFLQTRDDSLVLSNQTDTVSRYHDGQDDIAHASGRTALFATHLLVMEVNMAYLIRAVASRVPFYERPRAAPSVDVENDFGFHFAENKPYATLRYIVRAVSSNGRSLGETVYKINQGPHSQALQESVTDVFHSRVQQRPAIDSRAWEESIALLRSEEAEETTDCIVATLAAERVGFMHRDEWRKEKEARASQQGEVT